MGDGREVYVLSPPEYDNGLLQCNSHLFVVHAVLLVIAVAVTEGHKVRDDGQHTRRRHHQQMRGGGRTDEQATGPNSTVVHTWTENCFRVL
jgi:hypothetical protein